MNRRLPLLLGGAMLLTGPTLAAQPATAPTPSAPNSKAARINLPLALSGTYLGDVAAEIAADGQVAVAQDDLIRLLGPRLPPTARPGLAAAARADGLVALSSLKGIGITATYNPELLEIAAVMDLDAQGSRSLRIVTGADFTGNDFEAPAAFSVSSTFNLSQSLGHRGGPFSDFEPVKVANQTALNLGGEKGINLFAELFYDGAERSRFQRGAVTLTREDRNRALRLLAGDLSPATTALQSGQALGGFGVEKSYSELQPFRNVRPAGLFKFALEQDSVVEVVVNGAPTRAFRLERGQYDVRDFNFTSGLNRIEIYAIDDYGRRLIATFSQFFNFDLLDPGIEEFAAYVGVPQVRGGAGITGYDGSAIVTGYYRRGFTQSLTAGAEFQGDRNQQMGGLSAGYASRIGTFAVSTALSRDGSAGIGSQLLLNYQLGGERALFFGAPSLDLEFRSRSRNFVALGDLPASDLTRFDLRSRFSATIAKNYGVGLFGLLTHRHQGRPATYAVGANLSTQLLGFSVGGSVERARTDEGTAARFFLSFGRSLGRRGTSRSSFDSRTRSAQLEISRFRDINLSDFGYRAAIGHDRGGLLGTGELTYNANRAFLSVRHDLTADRSGGQLTHRSGYSAAVQLAYAGGRFGFGRPVGHNFLLAYPHRSLKSPVLVTQGVEDEKVISRSGVLGPALAPGGAAHSPRRVTVRAETLPDGYDPGKSYLEIFPGPANGYVAQVGSDENRTVQGNLVGPDGQPVSLAVGSLEWLDKGKRAKTQIFTNRAGRFVATGLAPGRYRLRIGEERLQAQILVPEDDKGVVEVGALQTQAGQD